MKKSTHQKVWPLILCFLLPVFIMAFYFAYRNMSPFGNRSILTVDLGQQYVDLFAYFRRTLLSNPSGIFYSFSKAFGGEMFGTWAYYLMSPVNLVLLLFPTSHLPAGILIVTLIKYGLSGLSFGYLLRKTIQPNQALIIMWSTIYALNGWIIANQLNIMWIDGMISLPLVILGAHQLFEGQHTKTFLVAMTLAIITNYYMAYMIALFTVIYIIFKFMTSTLKTNQFKNVAKALIINAFYSFCLTAWLTLPTLASLIHGKSHYSFPHVKFDLEYFPFKMFSKLFNGALDFDQLPNGLPNIFVGSVALISFLLYLGRHDIPFRQRFGCFIVTLILIISMCFRPLDLLWHAGQFPVWYPDRFSFIFCFWIIWIGANGINKHYFVSFSTSITITAILGSLIVYIFMNLPRFPFISPLNLVIGILFLLISFVLLIYTHNGTRLFSIALLILSTFEMTLNASNSLNNLSYISNASYTRYTKDLGQAIRHVTSHHDRIGKTFYRSKDDPFSNNYFGGDAFDSSLEYTTPKFMERIGQPEGPGFVTYTNGTLLSDQLLGFKYYVTTKDHHYDKCIINRPDTKDYPRISKSHHLTIHKNPNILPLIFPTYSKALQLKSTSNPMTNQERWYQAVTDDHKAKFQPVLFNASRQDNLRIHQSQLITNFPLRHGYSYLTLRPKLNHTYYLLIGPKINNKDCRIIMNGHELLPNTAYNHPIILNVASGNNTQTVKLRIQPLQSKLSLKPFQLYQLNNHSLVNNSEDKHSHVHVINNRKIAGQFRSTSKQTVMGTSIPATNGWHLNIDDKSHKIHKIAGEFIGASVKPGKHHVELTFTPPLLNLGVAITFLTLVILVTKHWLRIRKKIRQIKKSDYF